MSNEAVILTIGYGNRTVDQLIALLKQNGVEKVVDVRSAPYSKYNPSFSKEPLEVAVEESGLGYVFLGKELGGRPADPGCYADGKVDYDRVRDREFFREGLEQVCRMHRLQERVALMCSELRPEECHRSKLIGVALADLGVPVSHIDEDGKVISQDEAISRITGGQMNLFGDSFTSRKRYEVEQEDEADEW